MHKPKLITGVGLCEVNKITDALAMGISLASSTRLQEKGSEAPKH